MDTKVLSVGAALGGARAALRSPGGLQCRLDGHRQHPRFRDSRPVRRFASRSSVHTADPSARWWALHPEEAKEWSAMAHIEYSGPVLTLPTRELLLSASVRRPPCSRSTFSLSTSLRFLHWSYLTPRADSSRSIRHLCGRTLLLRGHPFCFCAWSHFSYRSMCRVQLTRSTGQAASAAS